MLRLASDGDVHGDIVRGLRRRQPDIDLVRIQDVVPEGVSDPTILAWAAAEDRVLITNDRNTMLGFAYRRVAAGQSLAGLIATNNSQSIGSAIDDILLIAEHMSNSRRSDATAGLRRGAARPSRRRGAAIAGSPAFQGWVT